MTTTEKKWSLPGMCFNTANPDEPKEAAIFFPSGENVTMPGSKIHSGQAVDADVAALFINNFYNYYKLTVNEDPEKAAVPQAENFESLITQHNALKVHHAKVKNINESIVNMTYGMTLDKDLLLAVLGQQGCEGIRFYLCGRQVTDDQAPEKKMHLSLVAVGVDKDGFDLNYNAPGAQPVNDLMAGLKSIPTQSVTLEYTTPPPPNSLGVSHDNMGTARPEDVDEHFALLKLARANQSALYEVNSNFVLI